MNACLFYFSKAFICFGMRLDLQDRCFMIDDGLVDEALAAVDTMLFDEALAVVDVVLFDEELAVIDAWLFDTALVINLFE
jgi:hypothetical protein